MVRMRLKEGITWFTVVFSRHVTLEHGHVTCHSGIQQTCDMRPWTCDMSRGSLIIFKLYEQPYYQ